MSYNPGDLNEFHPDHLLDTDMLRAEKGYEYTITVIRGGVPVGYISPEDLGYPFPSYRYASVSDVWEQAVAPLTEDILVSRARV